MRLQSVCKVLPLALLVAVAAGDVEADEVEHARTNDVGGASAAALFDEGVRLVDTGEIERACPKLEASRKLSPSLGTLLRLADCYDRAGKSASAWTTFREAAAVAKARGEPDRQRVAESRAAAIEPTLQRVSVTLAENRRVPGITITVGTKLVPESAMGTPLLVDPDEATVTASAPGYRAWSETVKISGSEPTLRLVDIPALVREPSRSPEQQAFLPPATRDARARSTCEPSPSRRTGDHLLTIGGAAVLGAGTRWSAQAFLVPTRLESRSAASRCAFSFGFTSLSTN